MNLTDGGFLGLNSYPTDAYVRANIATASVRGVVVQAASAQTAALFDARDSGDTASLFSVAADGHIGMAGIAGNPGTLTAGDIWYNTTQKAHRMQLTAGTAGLAGLLKAQTSIAGGDTINTTASETNFATNFQFPVNSLTVGKVIRVFASGTYGTLGSGTVTLRLKLKFGTVILIDSAAITTAISIAARYWEVAGYLTVISVGGSGTIECRGTIRIPTANTDVGFSSFGGGSLSTVDTTATQIIQVSAQHGASSASNTIVMRELVVEVMD